jgi:ribosomal protein S18 acetylase RimI-like enzyme
MLIRLCADTDIDLLERHMPTGRGEVHAFHLARQQTGASEYLVAWHDGTTPIGYGVINWTGFRDEQARTAFPACPEISNLGVDEPFRGQGVGTALIHEAERRAAARGFARVGLGVATDNEAAARLYLRLGYVDTGMAAECRYTYYDGDDVAHDVVEVDRYLVRDLT